MDATNRRRPIALAAAGLRFCRRAGFMLVPTLALLGLIELSGQIYAWWWPSFEVLAWKPDRHVGWTQVPGLRWTWAGHHWYAREFSVAVQTNSLGFRDLERTPTKPREVVRVALLGDSFVEAVQVELAHTAAQRLETTLNRRLAPARRSEVLNFGISGYSVGQYLLVWSHYVSQFEPDYVFAFVSGIQMNRTAQPIAPGTQPRTAGRALAIRPIFRIEGGRPIVEPANDFEEVVRVQQAAIQHEFGGGRMKRRSPHLFLPSAAESVRARGRRAAKAALINLGLWPRVKHRLASDFDSDADKDSRVLNLSVLEDLGQRISSNGGTLVIVDVSGYFSPRSTLPEVVRRFAGEHGYGYVGLTHDLIASDEAGHFTHWVYDGHFNELGNAIFAEAMHRWLSPRLAGDARH